MAYKITGPVDMRSGPSRQSEPLRTLARDTVLFGTGKPLVEADSVKWASVLYPSSFLEGWIPSTRWTEVPDPGPQPLDQELFVRQCLLADRMINDIAAVAPHFANADFVLARALLETTLTVTRFEGGYIAGPFRLSQAEWDAFLQGGAPVSKDFGPEAAAYPMSQVFAAAWRMHCDGKAFSEASELAVPQKDEPAIATYLDLLFCYLIGDPKKAFELGRLQDDATATLATALSPDQIAALRRLPPLAYLKAETPVQKAIEGVEKLFAETLDAAFALIQRYAPDELPVAQAGGMAGAPWLTFARAEEKAGVQEGSSDDIIRRYFKSTDYGGALNPVPNWCGAFAAYCMDQANADSLIPKGAALAANWKSWGDKTIGASANDIPMGTVVVLKPGPNTSGHIAFFIGFDAQGRLGLLGGNQGDRVKVDYYPPTRVSAIRILASVDKAPSAVGEFNYSGMGVAEEYHKYADLIVARFRAAGLTTRHHLVTALANAFAESGMNPSAASKPPERSYGLFQCNTAPGARGDGYTPEQLKDPSINISIIIKAAKASSRYVSAASVEVAMDAFVREVEIPANPTLKVQQRLAHAAKL